MSKGTAERDYIKWCSEFVELIYGISQNKFTGRIIETTILVQIAFIRDISSGWIEITVHVQNCFQQVIDKGNIVSIVKQVDRLFTRLVSALSKENFLRYHLNKAIQG